MLVCCFQCTPDAGIVVIIYPFAVFGYALLEETRPGKGFWRFMLIYSLSVLLLKYIVNLNFIHMTLEDTELPLIDGFIKFGLHHLDQTKDLVWHMVPEMFIVTAIALSRDSLNNLQDCMINLNCKLRLCRRLLKEYLKSTGEVK